MIGRTLGQYRVVSKLGEGGMGVVYQAVDNILGRKLAIKVLPDEVTTDPERLARFEIEARAASALNHPNIVTIYSMGVDRSAFFIAMEFVEGRSLHDILVEGLIPTHSVLRISMQLARGLAKAHESGIVHRDLKPGNIMVTKDGLVKILDFGLAKLVSKRTTERLDHSTGPSLTKTGVIMGTPSYMSPEQAQGLPIDFRSDQFSFGTILYEMATGKRPFEGTTPMQTIVAVSSKEPEAIATLNPAMPKAFQMLIDRCLAKDPKLRFSDTQKIVLKLEHLEFAYVSETLYGPRAQVGGTQSQSHSDSPREVVVGRATAQMKHIPVEESPLGLFVADVMRRHTGADGALMNAGGVQASLPNGQVTEFHVRFALPHLSPLVVCEVNGEALREALEQGLSMKHGMVQVSGINARYDPNLPVGGRLIEILVGGNPLDSQKVYRIATNSFVADGGDGFRALVGTKRTDTGQLLSDVVIAYLREKGEVDPPNLGRLVRITR